MKPVEQEELENVLSLMQKELFEEKGLPADHGLLWEEPEQQTSELDEIVKLVQESYTESISLTALSHKYKISVARLSIILKERLGLSFSEYIAAKRIQMAKELLKNDNRSLDEIAEQIGYHDYFYFIRVFKKVTGISPSKYRKNMLNEQN